MYFLLRVVVEEVDPDPIVLNLIAERWLRS